MRRFLIASHGRFSEGIVNSISMIIGSNDNVDYLSVNSNEGQEIIDSKIQEILKNKKETDELIVLTDILGGSVNNMFIKYMNSNKFRLIAGVNLPLALELITSGEDMETDELIESSIEKGKNGIIDVNRALNL